MKNEIKTHQLKCENDIAAAFYLIKKAFGGKKLAPNGSKSGNVASPMVADQEVGSPPPIPYSLFDRTIKNWRTRFSLNFVIIGLKIFYSNNQNLISGKPLQRMNIF